MGRKFDSLPWPSPLLLPSQAASRKITTSSLTIYQDSYHWNEIIYCIKTTSNRRRSHANGKVGSGSVYWSSQIRRERPACSRSSRVFRFHATIFCSSSDVSISRPLPRSSIRESSERLRGHRCSSPIHCPLPSSSRSPALFFHLRIARFSSSNPLARLFTSRSRSLSLIAGIYQTTK